MGCIGRPLVPIVAAMSTERPLGAAWHVERKKGPLSLLSMLRVCERGRRYHSSSVHQHNPCPFFTPLKVCEQNAPILNICAWVMALTMLQTVWMKWTYLLIGLWITLPIFRQLKCYVVRPRSNLEEKFTDSWTERTEIFSRCCHSGVRRCEDEVIPKADTWRQNKVSKNKASFYCGWWHEKNTRDTLKLWKLRRLRILCKLKDYDTLWKNYEKLWTQSN